MKYALFDYVTDKGTNDFKIWTEKLQKTQLAKLNARLDMLENKGSDLFPQILTGTDTAGIQKLRVRGKIELRPMVCTGPINHKKEFTLLVGAIEKQGKLEPKKADQIADKRKKEVIKDKTRRIDHERIS
jgi:hypothetical protein